MFPEPFINTEFNEKYLNVVNDFINRSVDSVEELEKICTEYFDMIVEECKNGDIDMSSEDAREKMKRLYFNNNEDSDSITLPFKKYTHHENFVNSEKLDEMYLSIYILRRDCLIENECIQGNVFFHCDNCGSLHTKITLIEDMSIVQTHNFNKGFYTFVCPKCEHVIYVTCDVDKV
jgi:hypothetical protein